MVDQVRFLSQRFQNTVIAIKAKKDGDINKPIKVQRFYTDDDGNIVIRYYPLGGDKEIDKQFNEEDFILDCPQVGMVEVGGRVLFIRRVPARQWKRGYTTNILRAEIVNRLEFNEVGVKPIATMQTPVVIQVYNPEYTPFRDGLEDILQGNKIAFAISRKFAVVLLWDAKFPVVKYKEWTVGWVDDGTVFLPEQSHHLFEELSQYAVCRRV